MTGFYEGTFGGPTPIPHEIGDHIDVVLTTPLTGDILRFDETEELWLNTPLTLESLSNVSVGSAGDGDVLTFDAGAQLWIPVAPTGGGPGTDDQTAEEVPFFPAGSIAATDVQAAIVEVDADVTVLKGTLVNVSTPITSFAASLLDDTSTTGLLTTLGLDTDLATLSLPASTTISTFGASLLDDANAAAALVTLGLDADLATLSVPANTTVGTFGKTLMATATEAAAKGALHQYDAFAHLAEGEPILIFAFGDSNITGSADINTSLISTDTDIFFYATELASGTFDPANLGWRNLDPNSTLRSSHQTDCASTTLVATGKTFTGQLCGGSNPPDMLAAYGLKAYTNRQVYVYKSAMGLQKAEAYLPGSHTPLYNVDGYTTIFGSGDDGFDAALAAFTAATGFTKTAADIVICSLGANDIARDPGVHKEGPTFYAQLQEIYDNCVDAGYVDPNFTQWFHIENVNNSNTAITDYYKTGWMGYTLMAANNTERFTLVSSLGAETVSSTDLHYTCEQYQIFGNVIARMASTNSASRSPIRENTYMSKLNPEAGGDFDMGGFAITNVSSLGLTGAFNITSDMTPTGGTDTVFTLDTTSAFSGADRLLDINNNGNTVARFAGEGGFQLFDTSGNPQFQVGALGTTQFYQPITFNTGVTAFTSAKVDGANVYAFDYNTAALSNASAYMARWRNNSNDRITFKHDGTIATVAGINIGTNLVVTGAVVAGSTVTTSTGAYYSGVASTGSASAFTFESAPGLTTGDKLATFKSYTANRLFIAEDGTIESAAVIKLRPTDTNASEYFAFGQFANGGYLDWHPQDPTSASATFNFRNYKTHVSAVAYSFHTTNTMTGGNIMEWRNSGLKASLNYLGAPGFWGVTPVTTQATAGIGSSGTFAGGGGTAATSTSTWTGGNGTTAYTVNDVVRALKDIGILVL